jgi:hypothetical protein
MSEQSEKQVCNASAFQNHHFKTNIKYVQVNSIKLKEFFLKTLFLFSNNENYEKGCFAFSFSVFFCTTL